jgi:hypothetical protein
MLFGNFMDYNRCDNNLLLTVGIRLSGLPRRSRDENQLKIDSGMHSFRFWLVAVSR